MNNYDLLYLGSNAMFAAQSQLQVTGHNITNASVEGYSRQKAELTTVAGKYTGSGYFGGGVRVDTITRDVNTFLTNAAGQTTAAASADQIRADMLGRLESSFGTGESGLSYATTEMLNAWSDLAATPADSSARQVVLSRAEDLAAMFRDTGSRLESLQNEVHDEVVQSVASVNEMARQVADLNTQIVAAKVRQQNPNDLLDQRDQLIQQISGHVQLTRMEQADGSVNLFVGVGQILVLGSNASQLNAAPSVEDTSRISVSISIAGHERPLDADTLSGGSLAGLLQFQNDDLTAARNRLDLMATSLALQVNKQQSLGLTLDGRSGSDLFALPASEVVAAQTNQAPAASVSLEITDSTALQAAEYELRADPANAGQYLVTNLSTGLKTSGVTNGTVIDGFKINIGTPAPGTDDRFRLKPLGDAAGRIALQLSQPADLAAASPATVSVATTNTGTAQVSSFSFSSPNTMPTSPMTLAFTNASGHYELRDSSGTVRSQGDWVSGSPISAYGFELKLTGVPKQGDQLTLRTTVDPASNNGNALALAGLADRTTTDGDTLVDAFSAMLGDVGLRSQQAQSAADASAKVADQITQDLTSQTGVNLDEEAARMIQYQQSYQAAAKVLQVAQKVFDTLLGLSN